MLSLLEKETPPEGRTHRTTWDIIKNQYASYRENIWEPEMRGILLHSKKLEGEGRVERLDEGDDLKHAEWVALSRTPTPNL